MKKILNGKMYNTETAVLLGNYCYSNPTDFLYVRENLYKKKTGEFFIYGEGGALTTYAERRPDGLCGGEAIRPITENEARLWCEKHLKADEYIVIFGEPEE